MIIDFWKWGLLRWMERSYWMWLCRIGLDWIDWILDFLVEFMEIWRF